MLCDEPFHKDYNWYNGIGTLHLSLHRLFCIKYAKLQDVTLEFTQDVLQLSYLLPHLANTTSSFLVPVFVHMPGYWGHQVSHPLTISCVAHEGDSLPAKITGRERTLAVIFETYRMVETLLNSRQTKVTENWRSLILSNRD